MFFLESVYKQCHLQAVGPLIFQYGEVFVNGVITVLHHYFSGIAGGEKQIFKTKSSLIIFYVVFPFPICTEIPLLFPVIRLLNTEELQKSCLF